MAQAYAGHQFGGSNPRLGDGRAPLLPARPSTTARALLDAYDPAKAFSSIDEGGRYAYGNQPLIVEWNQGLLCALMGVDVEAQPLDHGC